MTQAQAQLVDTKTIKKANAQADEASQIATMAQGIEIYDNPGFEEAGGVLVEIKRRSKELEARRKLITKPLMQAKKEVDSLFKAPLNHLKTAESALKSAIVTYQELLEQRRLEKLAEAAEIYSEIEKEGFSTKGAMEDVTDLMVEAETPQPKAQGVSIRTVKKFEVTDEQRLPRYLLAPDMAKIRAAVKSGAIIPGVRVWEEKSVAAG